MTALLALFDVDGTLFLTHDPLSSRALVATLEDSWCAAFAVRYLELLAPQPQPR